MTFWKMGVGSLNLHKTFTTDRLIAASSMIQVGRVIEEANGAFAALLVDEDLERRPVDKGVVRQVDLTWSQVAARAVTRSEAEGSGQGLAARFERPR